MSNLLAGSARYGVGRIARPSKCAQNWAEGRAKQICRKLKNQRALSKTGQGGHQIKGNLCKLGEY